MRSRPLPNFLYIGPDRAGSSWVYRVLVWHPEVHVTPAKDLYFFDRFYDRGLDWYARQFEPSGTEAVVAEITHDYLYSPLAAERIHRDLPGVRLMACLREPVERAHSAYLYMRATGSFDGSFEEALAQFPALLDHGRYASLLEPWLARFVRRRIHLPLFDELRADPRKFASSLFRFLGVERLTLPKPLLEPVRPAARARAAWLNRLARAGAGVVRRLGFPKAVGVLKTSSLMEGLLFKPYHWDRRPQLPGPTRDSLRARFVDEVRRLESSTGVPVLERWGYRSSEGFPP